MQVTNKFCFTFYNWLIETGDLGTGLGGLWSPLHFILMALLFTWIVVIFIVFYKHKNFALKTTTVLCYIMIIFRILRMLLLMITGKETVVGALPWHLCHIMAIVFPLFYLTKTKKFFLPIVCVTLFGGILTFIFGDYYKYSVLSFLQLESLLLHFLMPTVVAGVVASGYFEIKLEEFWQIPLFLLFLMAYAELGNTLVEGANFLFLRENGLPFNLFEGKHFMLTYLVLVAIISVIFTLPVIIVAVVKKNKAKKYRLIVRQNVAKN